jgi:hypothetical protein
MSEMVEEEGIELERSCLYMTGRDGVGVGGVFVGFG